MCSSGSPPQDFVAATGARSAHDRDVLGEEAAGDESEDLCGGLIEPLRVVDDADERLPLGDQREEPQRGEPDHERVRWWASVQSEHRREGVTLGTGQPVEVIQHRGAELMEAAVGQLHLGLNARRPCDMPALDTAGQVRQATRVLPTPASPRRTSTRL